ncbi:MAG: hypothetical protein AAGK24_05130, partial [Planctomycetota bacterium]
KGMPIGKSNATIHSPSQVRSWINCMASVRVDGFADQPKASEIQMESAPRLGRLLADQSTTRT